MARTSHVAAPPYDEDPEGLQRALRAEPQLRAVEAAVDALCALVRRNDTMCYACVWERIVKPLVSPLVGWERGYPPEQAKDPGEPGSSWEAVDLSKLMAEPDDRPPATTETECWMRTSEAYDAVTNTLVARLYRADPGTGHGVVRARAKRKTA